MFVFTFLYTYIITGEINEIQCVNRSALELLVDVFMNSGKKNKQITNSCFLSETRPGSSPELNTQTGQ